MIYRKLAQSFFEASFLLISHQIIKPGLSPADSSSIIFFFFLKETSSLQKEISIAVVQLLEDFLPLENVFSEFVPGFDNDISL